MTAPTLARGALQDVLAGKGKPIHEQAWEFTTTFPKPKTWAEAISALEDELALIPQLKKQWPTIVENYDRRAEVVRATLAWAKEHRDELAPALLTSYTEADIRARAAAEARREAMLARIEEAPLAEGFTLTGSNRPTDIASAHGQKELF